jgi:hypothetical protein
LADYVHFHDPERNIRRVSTSSHGGISVSRGLEMRAHLAALGLTDATGCLWFEEDLAWAAVPVAFPQHFSEEMVEAAQQTLRHHFPEAYVAQFGGVLTASTSRALAQREWEAATENSFVVTTGFGSWAWNVPPGHVYACGWRRRDEATAGFLVPAAEYVNEGRLVLDAFPRWEPDRTLPYFKPKSVPAIEAQPG